MYVHLYYHNGEDNFPHGAGPSEPGVYGYRNADRSDQPDGPLFDVLGMSQGGVHAYVDIKLFAGFTISEARPTDDPAEMREICVQAIAQILWFIRSTANGYYFPTPDRKSGVDIDAMIIYEIVKIRNFMDGL